MNRCPYCQGKRPTFINTSWSKYTKLVMEVCDCGYVLHKQRIPVRLNPNNFIKKADAQVFERRAVPPEKIGIAI